MDTEARKLEVAVEDGDFAAIPELAAAYGNSVMRVLAGTSDPRGRCALLKRAREVLNHSLQLAKVRRSHVAARLNASTSPYETTQTPLHTWHVEG